MPKGMREQAGSLATFYDLLVEWPVGKKRHNFLSAAVQPMKISFHTLVSVLVWQKQGLLLLRRRRHFEEIDTGKGLWELPGGKREQGEWPTETVFRELREETGWQVRKKPRWRTMFCYRLQTSAGWSYRLQLLYNIRLSNKQSVNLYLGEEHDDFKFVQNATELENLPMLPAIKRYLLVTLTGSAWAKVAHSPQGGTS